MVLPLSLITVLSLTHLSVELPGMKEAVIQIPQLQMGGIQKQTVQTQGMAEIPLPDYSLYKKCISKIYQRRGKKERSEGSSPSVFGELGDDYMHVAQNPDPDHPGSSSKRKATPVSIANLRRSKRNSNKGFKPITPVTPKSKKKQQKTPGKLQQGKQHLPFFSLTDFPDLAEVDRIIASRIKAPAISVDLLQKVDTERWHSKRTGGF
jgi:hypothetical protein